MKPKAENSKHRLRSVRFGTFFWFCHAAFLYCFEFRYSVRGASFVLSLLVIEFVSDHATKIPAPARPERHRRLYVSNDWLQGCSALLNAVAVSPRASISIEEATALAYLPIRRS
jgi:hypothetical protein